MQIVPFLPQLDRKPGVHHLFFIRNPIPVLVSQPPEIGKTGEKHIAPVGENSRADPVQSVVESLRENLVNFRLPIAIAVFQEVDDLLARLQVGDIFFAIAVVVVDRIDLRPRLAQFFQIGALLFDRLQPVAPLPVTERPLAAFAPRRFHRKYPPSVIDMHRGHIFQNRSTRERGDLEVSPETSRRKSNNHRYGKRQPENSIRIHQW